MRKALMIIMLLSPLLAASQLHYRVRNNVTGDWNGTTTWETSPTNANPWTSTTGFPDSSDPNVLSITIGNGETATIPNGFSVSADELTVGNGGTLNISNSGSLTILNGSGTDLSNAGTISSAGTFTVNASATFTSSNTLTISGGTFTLGASATLTNSGTMSRSSGTISINGTLTTTTAITGTTALSTTFNNGSRYNHNLSGAGIVPLATWATGSVISIGGFTGNFTALSTENWSQPFYDVEVNLTGLTNNTRVVNMAGFLNNISRNLSVISTGGAGGGRFRLTTTANSAMNIGGSLSTSIDTRLDLTNGATGVSLTVTGSVTNAGTLTMAAGATGTATLNVAGNFSNSGTVTTANNTTVAAQGFGTINFNGSTPQTFLNSGTISNHVRYVIPTLAIVDVGTSEMQGTGTFSLTGEIRVGSLNANGAIQVGNTAGNLRMTGTRTYNSGATITYNGAGAQIIGNGHPGTSGINLTVNNGNGVSYASGVTSLIANGLTLQSGDVNVCAACTFTVEGTYMQGSASDNVTVTNTSDLVVNGTGAFGNYPFPAGAQSFRSFALNRPSGSVTFSNDVTLSGNLILTAGDLIFNDRLLTLNGSFARTTGNLSSNASSSLTIGGSGAFGTLVFSTSGNTLNTMIVDRASGGTVALSGNLTVNNELYLTNGTFNNGSATLQMATGSTIYRSALGTAQGSLTGSAPGSPGAYNLVYNGDTDITTGLEAGATLENLTMNNSSSVTSASAIIALGDFNLNSGLWNCDTYTFSVSNLFINTGIFLAPTTTLSVGGNLTNNGSFLANGGIVDFSGSNGQAVTGVIDFANINVTNNSGLVSLESNATLSGVLSLVAPNAFFDADGSANTSVFTLLSVADEPSTIDASIAAIPSTALFSGNITVQRFMGAEGTVNRYISSPVSNALVSALSDDFSVSGFRRYNEAVLGVKSRGYASVSSGSTLATGRGYLAYMWNGASDITWDVSGPTNQGDINLNPTYTVSLPALPDDDGWNLLGNPYPSGIVWSDDPSQWSNGSGVFPTNIQTVITVPDIGGGAYRTFDASTNTGDLPGGIISMGQAFWVKLDASGPLYVHEAAKTATSGEFYRKSNTDLPSGIQVRVNDGTRQDNSFILVRGGSTHGYDKGMDASKFIGEFVAVYATDESNRGYSHMAIPDVSQDVALEVSMGLEFENKEFSLSFENIRALPDFNDLYLVDALLNTVMPISSLTHQEPYRFTISPNVNSQQKRFFLTRNRTPLAEAVEVSVFVYPNPVVDKLKVDVSRPGCSVELINNLGQTLMQQQLSLSTGLNTYEFDMTPFPAGVYFVKTTNGRDTKVTRILKQ